MSIFSPPPVPGGSSSLAPVKISPAASLELRLRTLEFLVSGDVQPPSSLSGSRSESVPVVRRIAQVQKSLEAAVQGKSGLERFVEEYDVNKDLIEPRLSLSNINPEGPTAASLDAEIALILDSEADILGALRDLEEVDALEKRGALDAGDLESHYPLMSQLSALQPTHEATVQDLSKLEARLAHLLSRYDESVSSISEAFLDLNSLVCQAEVQVTALEKAKQRRDDGGEL